jgi:ABC-2 type transport system ATP-binding protein
LIEVKNVTKKYGNFYAVRNINFEVKDGEIVGFLGRNGAGKSTTMNMITGFIEPSEGEIIVGGYNVLEKPKKVKAQIGYMPEGTPLYSDLTVKEFVSYMAELKQVQKKERKEAVRKAIESTGLDKVQNNLTKNLSRGYKQRVSLAGAIVGDPKILILDEPTVGLDPKQVIEIRELIKSFGKNHTVILSSHILSEVSQICEKVIIIDKGEIVAIDTPENLEKQTTEKITLKLVVDDMNNEITSLKDVIPEIESIEFIQELEDETKEYHITTSSQNKKIKSMLSTSCHDLGIVVIEQTEIANSLEDAFIKLVETRPEYSQKEVEKMQYDKEIDELREEEKMRKEEKANLKQAKKEEKARKNAEKEAKKEAKEENKKESKKETKEENKKENEKEIKEEIKEENKEGGDK